VTRKRSFGRRAAAGGADGRGRFTGSVITDRATSKRRRVGSSSGSL